MREELKKIIPLTRTIRGGDEPIVGYNHVLTKDDSEYWTFVQMDAETTLSISDVSIDKMFAKDYHKALKKAKEIDGFDDFKQEKQIEIILNLWRE